MINGINSNSKYITISGGGSSGPYISPGAAGAGMIRWNPNTNQMEVNDGNSWILIPMSYATINFNPEIENLLEWAKKKRDKEEKFYELASTNEAVRIALEQLEQAKTRLELTAHLAREYETTT